MELCNSREISSRQVQDKYVIDPVKAEINIVLFGISGLLWSKVQGNDGVNWVHYKSPENSGSRKEPQAVNIDTDR